MQDKASLYIATCSSESAQETIFIKNSDISLSNRDFKNIMLYGSVNAKSIFIKR